MVIPVNTIFAIILAVGGIFLQIFLSKKENKWLGLILPTICILFSLITILSIAAFTHGELMLQEVASDGTVIEQQIIEREPKPVTDIVSLVAQIISIILIYNIPTAILMIIYFACRQNIKKKWELEKMNIQDLE